jgi:DNA polymerase-4
VRSERRAKTISTETTFAHDISDLVELRRRLWPLCERVAERLKAKGLAGRTITLKMKTTRFKLMTRYNRLSAPTQLAETIFRAAEPLLIRETQGKSFRLIGVGVDTLAEASLVGQGDFFAESGQSDEARYAEVERAMDAVRAKFGRRAIRKGRADA